MGIYDDLYSARQKFLEQRAAEKGKIGENLEAVSGTSASAGEIDTKIDTEIASKIVVKNPDKVAGKKPISTRLREDIDESSPRTYGKNIYTPSSSPEDAKEAAKKVAHLKTIKNPEKVKEKNSRTDDLDKKRDAEIEKFFDKKETTTVKEHLPEIGPKPTAAERDAVIAGAFAAEILADKADRAAAREKARESKEQDRAEREANLATLGKELDDSRLAFAQMDIKKGQLWKRALNKLGFWNAEDVKQDDSDVRFRENRYVEARLRYQDAFIAEAKQGKISNKELGLIYEYLIKDETTRLYDSRTEARMENNRGTNFEKIKNLGSQVVNGYIKMPLKWKIALTGALAVAAVPLGTTFAGVLAGASLARRVLGGSAAAVGFEAMLEKRATNHRQKKTDRETAEYVQGLEKLTPEQKFELLEKSMVEKSDAINSEFQKRKLWSLFRKAGAVSVGVFFGSGVLDGIGRLALEKMGLFSENVPASGAGAFKEKVYSGFPAGSESVPDGAAKDIFKAPSASLDSRVFPGMGATSEQLIKPIDGGFLTVGEDDSTYAKLMEYFEGDKGKTMTAIKEYMKAHPEHGDLSLIHEGAVINMDGDKIISITNDPNLGTLPEKTPDVSNPEVFTGGGISEEDMAKFQAEAHDLSEQFRSSLSDFEKSKSAIEAIRSAHPDIEGQISRMSQEIGILDSEIMTEHNEMRAKFDVNFDGQLEAREMEEPAARISQNRLNSLTDNKMQLESELDRLSQVKKELGSLQDRFDISMEKMARLRKTLFSDDLEIKTPGDLEKLDAQVYLKNHASGKAGRVFEGLKSVLGEEAVAPKSGENMNVWLKKIFVEMAKAKK